MASMAFPSLESDRTSSTVLRLNVSSCSSRTVRSTLAALPALSFAAVRLSPSGILIEKALASCERRKGCWGAVPCVGRRGGSKKRDRARLEALVSDLPDVRSLDSSGEAPGHRHTLSTCSQCLCSRRRSESESEADGTWNGCAQAHSCFARALLQARPIQPEDARLACSQLTARPRRDELEQRQRRRRRALLAASLALSRSLFLTARKRCIADDIISGVTDTRGAQPTSTTRARTAAKEGEASWVGKRHKGREKGRRG